MKISLLLLLLPLFSIGQVKWRKEILPASLVFMAGAFDGWNQVLAYQYPSFKKAFPKSNDQYWSKEISFRNKYRNGDPAQGAKFPGSKGALVFLTDGYHMTRFCERLLLSGAFAVKIGQDKKRWWVYVIEGLMYWGVNRVGFCAVYNQFK